MRPPRAVLPSSRSTPAATPMPPRMPKRNAEFKRIAAGASYAAGKGLKVNAGHGLHYHNVKAIAAIPELYELNIGHAIIGRAAFGRSGQGGQRHACADAGSPSGI